MRRFNRKFGSLVCAICAGCALPAPDLSNDPAPRYIPTRSSDDPNFFTSIERVGKCEIKGKPTELEALRIEPEWYPPDSVRNHEEGTVHLRLIFDQDWCVAKAVVIQSSGYWRLDAVSLEFAIKQKWTPSVPVFIDGVPTTEIPIAWGASQGKHR